MAYPRSYEELAWRYGRPSKSEVEGKANEKNLSSPWRLAAQRASVRVVLIV